LKPVLITFSGIDGAGKSTQIEKLSEHLAQEGLCVRRLAFWDDVALFRKAREGFSRRVLQSDSSVGTPERPVERRDKNAQMWPLLVGRGILYVLDLINLRRVVREAKTEGAGVIIFDRYIYDQLAALPMDHWLAQLYARMLLRITPKPELSLLLDAVPEMARARKPEYPLDFMRRYRSSYLELRKIAGLQLIVAADPDDVHLAIVSHFTKSISFFAPQPEVDSAVIA